MGQGPQPLARKIQFQNTCNVLSQKGKKISAAGSEEEDGYLFADRTFPFPKARGTEI